MSCLIIGDSIAHGVAQIRPNCKAYTKPGISTLGWSKKWLKSIDYLSDVVMISLGSNDVYGKRDDVADELYRIRRAIGDGHKVIWILPAIKPWVKDLVAEVSYEFGDGLVAIPELSRDGVHPTVKGYHKLAENIK